MTHAMHAMKMNYGELKVTLAGTIIDKIVGNNNGILNCYGHNGERA